MRVQPGDRHYGEYANLLTLSDAQVAKSIRSYKKQIAHHMEKRNNPALHAIGWHNLDDREKSGLTRYWEKEIDDLNAKLALAQAVANERGL
ncbi:MAG: hypothetical protein LBE35_04495 [Clostridiales bacterium]|nr:hypothetical protein [Clostridiales bacterium]